MKWSTTWEAAVTTAGITLIVAYIASIGILVLAPTDSGQREFGHSAVSAVCWLYLVWAAVAIPTFAVRRPKVGKRFRLVFTINMGILALIVIGMIVIGGTMNV